MMESGQWGQMKARSCVAFVFLGGCSHPSRIARAEIGMFNMRRLTEREPKIIGVSKSWRHIIYTFQT